MSALYRDMPAQPGPTVPPAPLQSNGGVPFQRPMPSLQLAQASPIPEKLQKLLTNPNIADGLDDDLAGEIAAKVLAEYDIDKQSRTKLDEILGEASALAMLAAEKKNTPFEGAANVKYPLITVAALQFNARAYAAIVQGKRVVKCPVWGKDASGQKAARADRVADHMSYDLLVKMPEWEEDTDRLTAILPIDGTVFRKVFHDPATKRKVTRLVRAARLIVNYWARSLEDVPRITEEMPLYPYEIAERIRSGRFIEFDYKGVADGGLDQQQERAKGGGEETTEDPDGPQLFLEQHRLIDLDEDGYPEPYVATVHKQSGKLCRLVANFDADSVETDNGKVTAIRRTSYYVKYTFMPSPDGSFYGLGFGWLLKSTNEAINTTLNQMFDAGTLSNMQGGLVAGALGLRDRSITLKRGEWRVIQASMPLNQAVMPIKYDGPNAVMFQLLGLMVEAGKELASIKDVLTGDTPATAPVGTTLAMIQQGLQVFTSIYKRVHRSLKVELGMIARLNRLYLSPEEYARFCDGQPVDPKVDYAEDDDMDITPVTDPDSVTNMQRIARAQTVLEVAKGNPAVDPREATMRFFEAINEPDLDKLVPPPQPPSQLDMAHMQMMVRGAAAEIAGKEADAEQKHAAATSQIADAIKSLNEALGQDPANQLKFGQLMKDLMVAEHSMEMDLGQGGVPGMEGQPGNAGSVLPASGGGQPAIAGLGGQPAPQPGPVPGPMGGSPAPAGL